jgi:hypothetical protein
VSLLQSISEFGASVVRQNQATLPVEIPLPFGGIARYDAADQEWHELALPVSWQENPAAVKVLARWREASSATQICMPAELTRLAHVEATARWFHHPLNEKLLLTERREAAEAAQVAQPRLGFHQELSLAEPPGPELALVAGSPCFTPVPVFDDPRRIRARVIAGASCRQTDTGFSIIVNRMPTLGPLPDITLIAIARDDQGKALRRVLLADQGTQLVGHFTLRPSHVQHVEVAEPVWGTQHAPESTRTHITLARKRFTSNRMKLAKRTPHDTSPHRPLAAERQTVYSAC